MIEVRGLPPFRDEAAEGWGTQLSDSEGWATRLLGVDVATAKRWGEWCARRRRPVVETLLGASASVRGMTLVTRGLRNLGEIEVLVLDPWRKKTAG